MYIYIYIYANMSLIRAGASHIIVTSYVFTNGKLDMGRCICIYVCICVRLYIYTYVCM